MPHSKYDFIMPHSHEFTDTQGTMTPLFRQRMAYALSLFRQGVSDILVVSGTRGMDDVIYGSCPITLADAMRQYFVRHGVPESRIIGDGRIGLQNTTWTCLQYVHKDIVVPNGFRKGVMVSNVEHLPRLRFQAQKIFGSLETFPLDYRGDAIPDWAEAKKFMEHELKSLEQTLQRPD